MPVTLKTTCVRNCGHGSVNAPTTFSVSFHSYFRMVAFAEWISSTP